MSDREETMEEESITGDTDMKENDEDSDNYEDAEDDDVEENDEEGDSGEENDDEDQEDSGPPKTYLPGKPLEDGEELVCDENAYIMFHQANTGMQFKKNFNHFLIYYFKT